jgi:hypothetical protein
MDSRVPFPLRAERLIQEIFAPCFVDVSVHMGLTPDPLDLVLSADGSSLRTGSCPYGVKVCDCRKICEFWGIEPFIDLNSKGLTFLPQRVCYVFLWF